ncbi:MAG: hypothetical protein JNJ99_02045 [Crocinitomicaceae bacterium]|nr:hypothetical protein [Crocinitomicaceae bacterium]
MVLMHTANLKYFLKSGYRYSFQGQEKDDEVAGASNSISYTYRMHDVRVGRFFAVDPLAGSYPWNSPYAFSENRIMDALELEGLESITLNPTLEMMMRVSMDLSISMPKVPMAPTLPVPPITINLPIPYGPAPISPTMNHESGIDWTNPPRSPEELGEDWVLEKSYKNGEYNHYKNQKTGEKLRWDLEPDHPAGGHWHRPNPNYQKWMKDSNYYLDRYGKAVDRGSIESHIYPNVPGVITLQTVTIVTAPSMTMSQIKGQIQDLKKLYNDNPAFRNELHQYIQQMEQYKKDYKQYKKDLEQYQEDKEDYDRQMEEYWKNCDICA